MKLGFIALTFALLISPAFSQEQAIDGTIAIVSGNPILYSDLEEAQIKITAELKRANKWDEMGSKSDFQKRVLDQLINDRLLEEELGRRGLGVDDSDVDNAIASIKKDNNITSQSQFEEALRSEGFSMSDYRKNLKKQIVQSRVLGALVRPQVKIRDEDIARALKKKGSQATVEKKYQIAMIYKAKPATQMAQMKKLRTDIIKTTFEEVAKKTSEGPAKEDGGLLGSFLVSDLQMDLQKVVPSLKKGEVSEILENEKGFTLIKLVDVSTGGLQGSSSSETEAIREKLSQEESARIFEQVVRDLREKARIQVNL